MPSANDILTRCPLSRFNLSVIAGRVALISVLVFAFILLVCFALCSSRAIGIDTIDKDDHDLIVTAMQAHIDLLRWGLIVIVPALVAAIGLLWRANIAKDLTILSEVKSAAKVREDLLVSNEKVRESNDRLREAIDGVSRVVETVDQRVMFCESRRKREEIRDGGSGG